MKPSNATWRAYSSTSAFPTSPTWDGMFINFTSILFWHRLQHNCLHLYTREWVWCAIFLDSIALIELKLSVRIRHISGSRITSAMCRSAVNRALSSAVKTPAGLGIHAHPFDEQQNPHNPQSKSHPYKKSTTHHIRTSQSIARGALPMNTHRRVAQPTESSNKISEVPVCKYFRQWWYATKNTQAIIRCRSDQI
jgi:hypothetical protein